MSKFVRITEKKLGRHRFNGGPVLGLCYENGHILIDPRQDPKEFMGTIIHECLHAAFDCMSEESVIRAEKLICDALWEKGYRRIVE